jgi:hypothetical protein
MAGNCDSNISLQGALMEARTLYVTKYKEAWRAYRSQHNPSSPEVQLVLNRSGVAEAYRIWRVDMASYVNKQLQPVETAYSELPCFQPFSEETPLGVLVIVTPFVWNNIEFRCQPSDIQAIPLEQWCLKWLDRSESNPRDEDHFLGVIHTMSAPEIRDGRLCFSVDFGSAPVTAVNDLLELLSKLGAAKVELGLTFVNNPVS